jgi:hypothetical protein
VNACPHCGSAARIERSAALRWRCGVCGGPVVPADGPAAPRLRSNAELEHLVGAQRSRAMALGWTAGAAVLGACAVMGLALASLLWLASHAAALVLAAVAVAAALLALAGLRRARQRGAEASDRLEQAWGLVAAEALHFRAGVLTAEDLAASLHTDVPHAERLLSRLSAQGRARVEIRDDAELTYRAEEAPRARAAELDETTQAPVSGSGPRNTEQGPPRNTT